MKTEPCPDYLKQTIDQVQQLLAYVAVERVSDYSPVLRTIQVKLKAIADTLTAETGIHAVLAKAAIRRKQQSVTANTERRKRYRAEQERLDWKRAEKTAKLNAGT